MSRRGTAILFLMTLIGVLGIAAALTTNLASLDVRARPADDVRVQALWLARSALDAGVAGRSLVDTPEGVATVEASAAGVVVELAGARATVQVSPYQERFEAATIAVEAPAR